jgi:hydroxymethylbilane synthase
VGLAQRITAILAPEEILPAAAQGAIGIECRADDTSARDWAQAIDDAPTAVCVTAERAVLAALGGSCRTPIAALAELEGGALRLRAMILRPDGSERLTAERRGGGADAAALGADAGAELRRRADPRFFAEEDA